MKKYNREELDQRLARLRESRMNDESYYITTPRTEVAMCYSISIPADISLRRCDNCNHIGRFTLSYDAPQPSIYEDKLSSLTNLGLDARLYFRCRRCLKNDDSLKEFEIQMRAEDDENYHISYPEGITEADKDKTINYFELSLIENFLKVPLEVEELSSFFDRVYNVEFRAAEKEYYSDKPPIDFRSVEELTLKKAFDIIKPHSGYTTSPRNRKEYYDSFIFGRFCSFFTDKYSCLTYKGLNSSEKMYDKEDCGHIKTQIDMALAKGLGLVAVYDKEEVLRNIDLVCSQDKRYLKNKQAVLQRLEKEWREPFTVFDYCIFMDSCKEALERE